MSFTSAHFLIFFPVVALLYYVVPQRFRYIWLLIASYYFYMGWNPKYAILILLSTAITYASGLWLAKIMDGDLPEEKLTKRKNLCVFLSFFTNLGILFFFKYTNFLIANITKLSRAMGGGFSMHRLDIILPVGISFYTFQALSYTMDVYRGEVKAEKNFARYALFVSFFPQLVAGPIERSKNLLKQVNENHPFEFENIREGFMLMLWGYFMKLVIADRAAILVDTVYGSAPMYNGACLAVATVLFAVQIYCDFGGYSTIAIGAAKMMGFSLMENFESPYLSRSVAEFWRRWHISLSSWFRDYLYIPLGGNRKGKVRKWINIMIVFLVSGLWHGANWTYVMWGGLNGLFQLIGTWLKPVRDKAVEIFHVDRNSVGHKLCKVIITFILVDFTWIFFRASTVAEAFYVIRSIFGSFAPWSLVDGTLFTLSLSRANVLVLFIAIFVLLFADIAKYKGIKIREVLCRQNVVLRWAVLLLGLAIVLVFGIWGYSYNPAAFIYFQF